jgi:hypothetical protein
LQQDLNKTHKTHNLIIVISVIFILYANFWLNKINIFDIIIYKVVHQISMKLNIKINIFKKSVLNKLIIFLFINLVSKTLNNFKLYY